jgi:hypothetical protein
MRSCIILSVLLFFSYHRFFPLFSFVTCLSVPRLLSSCYLTLSYHLFYSVVFPYRLFSNKLNFHHLPYFSPHHLSSLSSISNPPDRLLELLEAGNVPIPDITSGAILLQPPTPILRGKCSRVCIYSSLCAYRRVSTDITVCL